MRKIILLGAFLLVLITTVVYFKNNPTLYKRSYHIKQEVETYWGSKPIYKDVDYTINYTKGDNVIMIVNKNGTVVTKKIFKVLGDTLCVPSSYVDYFIFGATIKETKRYYGYESDGNIYTKEYIY